MIFAILMACGPSPLFTYGETCADVGRAACLKALECNTVFTDEDLCTDQFVEDCCGETGDCEEFTSDPIAWTRCKADIEAFSCEDVENIEGIEEDLRMSCDLIVGGD
ncbi:MAG: hypothetical protein AAF602_03250 [Myxococcota bacterium]